MSRIFTIDTDSIKSQEIVGLIQKVRELAGDGYEVIHKNYEPFIKPFKKILRLAKQEKEWYLYFYTIDEILYLCCEHGKYDEVVKYAELYYKDSSLYMDREIPNYPEKMAHLNTWIYNHIFEAYYQYHQIDDVKMDAFMDKYEENALKYGKTYVYYEDEMNLCVLYRDAQRARSAAQNFRRYENDMESCYVCGHKPYLAHLLLIGENRQAEELLCDFINKNIPKQHLWCYKYCRAVLPESLYRYVLYTCVMCGNEGAFCYFYKKYWKKLPYESRWESDATTFRRLLCVLAGTFKALKDDIREAEEDIKENEKHETTVGNVEIALDWWCYFTLLDRSGVHEVEISLPGLNEADKETGIDAQTAESGKRAGKVPALTVASYMEKRADEFGALFSKARARFDYEGLKDTYRNCFL